MQPLKNDRITPFANLGLRVKTDAFQLSLEPLIQQQYYRNPWFTTDFCNRSLLLVEEMLDVDYLKLKFNHDLSSLPVRTVGIVPDGRIPLSAFPDMLCAVLMGFDCVVKPHPKDDVLLPALIQELETMEPLLRGRMRVVDKLPPCDAVIVHEMEDNNGLWERYLHDIPHLLSPVQQSVAWLAGRETEEELQRLAVDMVLFFGRARQSVRTILVPEGYDFVPLLQAISDKSSNMQHHNQLLNHLDYQKSIRLMGRQPYMDAGTFLLAEDTQEIAPTGVIRYVYYQNPTAVHQWLRERKEMIYAVEGQGFDGMKVQPFGSLYTDRDLWLDKTIHFLQTIG